MVDKTTFGQELKMIRLARGKSQKYFSYQLGLAVWTYGKIERDEVPVGSDHLYNLLHNDRLTRKEQAILAEKYQEKVDDEWVEPKPKPKKKKKRVKSKPKKDKLAITDEQRAEYRRRKSERYFKEYKPKKSTNKEIKRARSMSAIQKVFY